MHGEQLPPVVEGRHPHHVLLEPGRVAHHEVHELILADAVVEWLAADVIARQLAMAALDPGDAELASCAGGLNHGLEELDRLKRGSPFDKAGLAGGDPNPLAGERHGPADDFAGDVTARRVPDVG